MKRCPQCNRVETDEALKFCRVDGATLISDSSSIVAAGTAGVGPDASEVHTSILPHRTDANINRATAPTTVLPAPPAASATHELPKPKRRKTIIIITVILTAVVAATTAVL
ncbi:MAG TPA: hypothetical protein VFH01_03080, partial [Pyrinomonadaceae bacterium]|nr:hypothetical protein [Pyrinomonadaceae bacterium]